MSIKTYRDGQLDPTYKRKQATKHIRYAVTLFGLIVAHYTKKASKAAVRKLDELSRPVRLDIVDYMYGTNLRSQYFAGRRTQKILSAKRQFGLI